VQTHFAYLYKGRPKEGGFTPKAQSAFLLQGVVVSVSIFTKSLNGRYCAYIKLGWAAEFPNRAPFRRAGEN
jgi:hypothetical protein